MNDPYGIIKKITSEAAFTGDVTTRPIGSGYASMAYEITDSSGEYVALTPKVDTIAMPNYAYYFAILKTLESIDYKPAPKAIYLNPERSVIVMTKSKGEKFSWVNSAPGQTRRNAVVALVDALLGLRQASFDECARLYRELSGDDLEATTIQKDVKHFMTGWYEAAQSTGCSNVELTEWVKPKIALYEKYAMSVQAGGEKVLVHGDTTEGNILLTRDMHLSLIDWDTSGFRQYPDGWDDYGIAYLFNHVPALEQDRSFVVAYVSEKCKINEKVLEQAVAKSQELVKINDIMWAYMMNARAAAGEIDDEPSKFLAIAKQRISDYEALYAEASFLRS